MIDATTLFKGTTIFSPWFPRQAGMLRVTAECVVVNGATLTVKLYTKNVGDVGDGDPVDEGTSITLSAAGRSTAEWRTVESEEGVLELLRFQYVVTGSVATNWILFRLLPPIWFDAVAG
jgi:hypothetical protein